MHYAHVHRIPIFVTSLIAAVVPNVRHAQAKGSYTLKQLPNGVHVILAPDHRYPQVAVVVRYYAGVRHETPGKLGLAHLLEHVSFRPPRPEALLSVNVAAQSSHGENASTHPDFTQYYHLEPSYRLQTALWEERWRLTAMPTRWSASDVEWERPIVRNEGRFRGETRPHHTSLTKMFEALFPAGHPFRGLMDAAGHDLDAITFSDVKQFFEQWYVPSNAWIAVVGDFHEPTTNAMIDSYFGSLPAKAAPAVPVLPDVTLHREVLVENVDPLAPRPLLMMAWHTPAAWKPFSAEAEVMTVMLGEARASRLRALGTKAAWVRAEQVPTNAGSVFILQAEPLEGVTLEELKQDIDARLMGYKSMPPSDRELDRATRALLRDTFVVMEGTLSRAATLIDMAANVGDVDPVSSQRGRYTAVTGASVSKFTESYLGLDQRVVVFSKPAAASKGPQ